MSMLITVIISPLSIHANQVFGGKDLEIAQHEAL